MNIYFCGYCHTFTLILLHFYKLLHVDTVPAGIKKCMQASGKTYVKITSSFTLLLH